MTTHATQKYIYNKLYTDQQIKRSEIQKDLIGGKFNQHLQNKIKSLENRLLRKTKAIRKRDDDAFFERCNITLYWEQSTEQSSTKKVLILIYYIH